MNCQNPIITSTTTKPFIPNSNPLCIIFNNFLFKLFISSTFGGAISSTNSEMFIKIYQSIFLECSCQNYYGGALYLIGGNNKFIILESCFEKCFSSLGCSIFISKNILNDFNLSSSSFCSPSTTTNSKCSLYFDYCSQIVIESNCSKNYLSGQVSSFIFIYTNSINLKFTQISNTETLIHCCLDIESSNGNNSISNCNIISNKIGSNSYGIICSIFGSKTICDNLIINLNIGNYFTGDLILINCKMDKISGDPITLINCITNSIFPTLKLLILFTKNCKILRFSNNLKFKQFFLYYNLILILF